MASPVPTFSAAQLEQICGVLGDTNTGLTGADIGKLLKQLQVDDPAPTLTKRVRLFEALAARQQRDGCGNIIAAFVHRAMDPVRYTGQAHVFNARREALNSILAFCGLTLREDGRLARRAAARTLNEAEQRANRLRHELIRRGVHADVIRFCQAELLQENCFHAIFEATKSVAEKIRQKTGLSGDGAAIVDPAFGGAAPLLAINSLRSETEQSEQRGFVNLLKGFFGTFRNVTGHAPKITWPIKEEDALDLFSLASYLHRRLDAAVPTRPPSS